MHGHYFSFFRATCLKQDGVIIPNEARLYAMLIESDALQADSALVDDERTCDFQIARHINDFQVSSIILIFILKNMIKIKDERTSHCSWRIFELEWRLEKGRVAFKIKVNTRKSSCVNARGIPTVAYQVLHMLSYPGGGGGG